MTGVRRIAAARRAATIAAFAVVVAAPLAGCGGGDDGGVRLTLWHTMRPEDREILRQRLEAFEAANPGVRVSSLYKETEELRSGLESAVLVGRGPDVVYGPSDPVGVYDEIGALRDLSQWFDADDRAAFDERALVFGPPAPRDPDAPSQGDSTAATDAPSDAPRLLLVGDRFGNHLALVWNRRLLERPPATTDELVALAKSATVDEDGDGRPDRFGLVWNYTEPFFVVPFLKGYGAWVFKEPTPAGGRPEPNLDTPEAIRAYRFVYSLRDEHRVLPESADYENAAGRFKAGKAAMLIDGDWSWQGYLQESQRQKAAGRQVLDAAIAPLPVCSATGEAMGGMVAPKGYSLSIAAQGERLEPAVALIRFLTSVETQSVYLNSQKIYPSRLALRDEPILSADPTLRASIEQIDNSWLMPTATELRAVWDAMRPPYEKLMGGQKDAADAAAEMQALAIDKIETLTGSLEPDATRPLVIGLGYASLLAILWLLWRFFVAARADFAGNRLAYLLAAPAMLLIFATVVFPLAYNVGLSFSNMSLQDFDDPQIIGLRNYNDVFFGDKSRDFWLVFVKTVFWTVVNVGFHVAIGVFLAVVLNGPVRGKSVYRLLLIIPWAVPAYITALTWRGMFDAEFGAVNKLVRGVNAWLPAWLDLPVVNWLTEAGPAFTACIVANVWLGFPFMMVITLGGLQGIPQDLYEAARIDRASRWQQFWNITVPMLKPVLLPAIVLGSVWTFNNLNVVWLVSNGGEPADQTHILVSYVYRAVFNLYQYGYGAALSMVIFAMLLTFSVAFLRQTKAAEGV